MNAHQELHTLIDGLNVSDAKQRLHALIAEMDDELADHILVYIESFRRRHAANWGFRM